MHRCGLPVDGALERRELDELPSPTFTLIARIRPRVKDRESVDMYVSTYKIESLAEARTIPSKCAGPLLRTRVCVCAQPLATSKLIRSARPMVGAEPEQP